MPCILRAPAARGLAAVGLTSGGVALVDPRASMAAQHSIAAHSAGLADVDVRGDMLATCGYGTRQGQVVFDSYVKVGPDCLHCKSANPCISSRMTRLRVISTMSNKSCLHDAALSAGPCIS